MAVDQIILELRAEAKQFKAELAEVRSQVAATEKKTLQAQSNMGGGFNQIAGNLKNLAGTIGVAFGVQQIFEFGKATVAAASDLNETQTKVQQLFGSSTQAVNQWAAGAAQAFGQSKQQALDAASTFALFGNNAGLAGEDLVNFSTDFTELASDFASFYNTSPEDAINAIGAALRGEAEPIRRYQILLDEASLKQEALRLGLIKTTKDALTPQNKILATQALIYKQATPAIGDFAETSKGLANQQRILAAEFENIKTEIGKELLPVILELTQGIMDLVKGTDFNAVMKELMEIVSVFVQPIRDAFDSISNLASAFSGASSEGDKLVSILDVLGTVIKIITIPLKITTTTLTFLIDKFTQLVKWFRRTAEEGGILGTIFEKIGTAASWVIDKLDILYESTEKQAKSTETLTKATVGLNEAVKGGIIPIKQNTTATEINAAAKEKQIGAYEKLTKQVTDLNKELLDNITLNKDTYKEERKLLELQEKINKIQFEANSLLMGNIALTGVATEINKEYFKELQKQPQSYKDIAEAYRAYSEIAFSESPEERRARFIRDMQDIANASSALASAMGEFGTTLTEVFGKAAQDNAAFAGFLKGITIIEITLAQASAIAQAIAKIAAGDPLSVITGAISLVSSVTALFGGIISQIEGTEIPQAPAFAEGSPYVSLNGNPKGVDTIPAYLNEGEAVIPTDRNKKYPGLASAWINNKLDDYIMSNWVAPAIESERNKSFADNLAEAIKVSGVFDDYRLYRAISEQTSVNKSGFKKLDKVISKSVNPRLRYD